MQIVNHRLVAELGDTVRYMESPHMGGPLQAECMLIHYTGSRSADAAIRWLTQPAARASAHLVIGRDGVVTQLVPLDRIAFHAGPSWWNGRPGLNSRAIGIELDNAGCLTRLGDHWQTWFGSTLEAKEVIEAAHPLGGPVRGWHAYTQEQLVSALAVGSLLVEHYGVRTVLGHDEVTDGLKLDPGPAFPMETFRSTVLGRHDERPQLLQLQRPFILRRGAGIQFEAACEAPLPTGTQVVVLQSEGSWRLVDVIQASELPALLGWIHSRYLALPEQTQWKG